MSYNFKQFLAQFPTDEVCLSYLCALRFPGKELKRVKGRMTFYDRQGKFYYPMSGTIFEQTRTDLTKWFFAIFLFANSRNSISAKELQRQIGVTYKCAWRICHQIRSLMEQDTSLKLSGIVEADETYIGGTRRLNSWKKTKTPIVGLIERKTGTVIAKALPDRSEYAVCPFITKHVLPGSTLYTDSAPVFNTLKGFKRGRVVHTKKEYVRGNIHTNNIEGFWGHLKKCIKGTHTSVSPKHLQSYLDAAAFRWNNRENVFAALMQRVQS